ERIDAAVHAVPIDIFDEIQTEPFHSLVAELDHLLELPRRVDVHQREGRLGGIEGLHRQMQHHAGILADGIEHHRIGELGRHLAHDVNALGLQAPEMRYYSLVAGQFRQSRNRTVKYAGWRGDASPAGSPLERIMAPSAAVSRIFGSRLAG